MAEVTSEAGTYALGAVVRLYGSFQTNGSSAVTVIRDGHSSIISSVTRISAGLFEVTIDSGFPIPEKLVTERAWGTPIATPVTIGKWDMVAGSYVAREIECLAEDGWLVIIAV